MINLDLEKELALNLDLAAAKEFQTPTSLTKFSFGWLLWTFNIDKSGEIKLAGMFQTNISKALRLFGYRIIDDTKQLIRINDGLIELIQLRDIRQHFVNLIERMDEEITIADHPNKIRKSELLEMFLRRQHNSLNESSGVIDYISSLEHPILQDDKETCYIPFQNGVVAVTTSGHQLIPYPELEDKVVWKSQILPREFHFRDYSSSPVMTFISNVAAKDPERINNILSIIGYLVHNHSSTQETKAVYIIDEFIVSVNIPSGGSGKGILLQIVGTVRNVTTINGKSFDPTGRFAFQKVSPLTQVIHIDDAKNNFDPDALNSILSAGLEFERKNQDPVRFEKVRSPKFAISSNTGIKSGGTTRERRQHVVLLDNYYSRLTERGITEPIIHEHGKAFFDESWIDVDWNMSDSLVIDSVQHYLMYGLSPLKSEVSKIRRINLRTQTCEEFVEFIESIQFDESYSSTELYDQFIADYKLDIKQRGFSNWVTLYATVFHYEIDRSEKGRFTLRTKN